MRVGFPFSVVRIVTSEERQGSPADHPLVPSVRFQKTVRDFGWNACAAAWSSLHFTLPYFAIDGTLATFTPFT